MYNDYSLVIESKLVSVPNCGKAEALDLDENSNFTEEWIRMTKLFRLLQKFDLHEVTEKGEVVLSPLGNEFKMDLKNLVTECSFLTGLSIFAIIRDDKVILRLMK